MTNIGVATALMGCSFVVAAFIYPYVCFFAKKHNIVDNPSARKLQRVPIPVMGGTTAILGLLVAVIAEYAIFPDMNLLKITGLLTVMFLIGLWDDIKDVSAVLRFFVEIFVVWSIIGLLGLEINNLHGLWGIWQLPEFVSIPLTLVAGVGIMNAINLIDGVDGYCSMYCMLACVAFAIIFFNAGDWLMFSLALIAVGAVIPFFFHNVFGQRSKMFMGDSGSLMYGTIFAIFVLDTLSVDSQNSSFDAMGLSLPAVVLAILAVPVFDTLKVMIFRVKRGISPFHPDKTHLHHLFIDLNFSHLFTSGIIVFANLLILFFLVAGWKLGMSMEWQLYLVVGLAMLFTWGFYFFMNSEHHKNDGEGSRLWQRLCTLSKVTNVSSTSVWRFIQRIVDGKMFGEGFIKDDPNKT